MRPFTTCCVWSTQTSWRSKTLVRDWLMITLLDSSLTSPSSILDSGRSLCTSLRKSSLFSFAWNSRTSKISSCSWKLSWRKRRRSRISSFLTFGRQRLKSKVSCLRSKELWLNKSRGIKLTSFTMSSRRAAKTLFRLYNLIKSRCRRCLAFKNL